MEEQPPEQSSGRRIVRTRTRAPSTGDLARQIEIEHRAFVDAANNAMARAIRCGKLLVQAKARVGHGNWLSWVEDHLTIGIRQVQNYMRVAEHPEVLANAQCDAYLTIDGALTLIAAQRRETPTPTTVGAPARAPATTNARTAALSRTPTRPVPQQPTPAPDHIARLQDALATIMDLPEPEALATCMISRRVDLHDQLERAGQYIARLARRASRARRLSLASARVAQTPD